MSIGNVSASAFQGLGAGFSFLRPTTQASNVSFSGSAMTAAISAAEIWSQLEGLRAQRHDAEADLNYLPAVITDMQKSVDIVGSGVGKPPAYVMSLLESLRGDGGGAPLQLSDPDDVAIVARLLQTELLQLQQRWQRATITLETVQKETARLQAELKAKDVQYNADTGELKHLRTGQSEDPSDLIFKLWDKLKADDHDEMQRRIDKRSRHEDPRRGVSALLTLMARLAGGETAAEAEATADHEPDEKRHEANRKVRAYMKAQYVVSGGTADGRPRQTYTAVRPVWCKADEVGAGNLVSEAIDTFVISYRGYKELNDPNRPGDVPAKTGSPAAFATIVA